MYSYIYLMISVFIENKATCLILRNKSVFYAFYLEDLK